MPVVSHRTQVKITQEGGQRALTIGDGIVRASTQQPRLYVGMVLILIFAEVLGLYGVIVSILMLTRANQSTKCLV